MVMDFSGYRLTGWGHSQQLAKQRRDSLHHHARHGESVLSEECLYFSEEAQQMKQSFTFHHSCITIGARKKGLTSLRAMSCNKYTAAHGISTQTYNHVAICKHH